VDLAQGKLVIVCDDEDRENEGDLVGIAEFMTAESVNFMITHAKGLLCAPVSSSYAKRLGLTPMVNDNQDNHQTAFTQSIDYKTTTTGISAAERALTLQKLADPEAKTNDFRAPGHIFPLLAKDGGVIERQGHTEAAVDLALLCEANPVGVICEIINPDGTMARLAQLYQFAQVHQLKLIHIADLVKYRKRQQNLLTKIASSQLATKYGEFELHGFCSVIEKQEVIVLTKGDISQQLNPLVRIHSECLTGDGFGSLRCDCGEQLAQALELINHEGGALIYLRQEGRGIGLLNKIKAYALQDQGMDTVEANLHLGFADDLRDYYLAAQALRQFKVTSITLLSNNPRKFSGLNDYGIKIAQRRKLIICANSKNKDYLQTKVDRLGHLLTNTP
jgi:3,4-dihydroxy 2-butanone 4-phosphate synthase/GTP cyclohydrolase II